MRLLICLFLSLLGVNAIAADYNAKLARQNYMLNCQGCHLPDGSGSKDVVPNMNGFVANFLHVPGGREFIVQVPGSASAPISDEELAGVMNWLLVNFSKDELPEDFKPYTAAEVGELRKDPLVDVNTIRPKLIEDIEKTLGVKEES